ncbi:MAG: hypothetical protein VST68_10110 [Nitrospirota bacterium]|nr:hypothetical protein [Nitrospirota bacterium]
MNITLTCPIHAGNELDISSRREWSKSPSSKAAASLTRGTYSQYMSANAAKSGKSVSPKVRQPGENAVGGFFQHSHH